MNSRLIRMSEAVAADDRHHVVIALLGHPAHTLEALNALGLGDGIDRQK